MIHLATRRWSEVSDSGPEIQGRFGHSLVAYVHEKKDVVLIYGGYMPPNDASSYSTITDTLVEYTCDSQKWSLLFHLFPSYRFSFSQCVILLNGHVSCA